MRHSRAIAQPLAALCLMIGIAVVVSPRAFAHCDAMDGPVVQAARAALANKDVNLALIWVRNDDEAEIRRAFDRTINIRELGSEAKELVDTYFFETLVRLHRAGEGAAFTGLKPAGQDRGPAIPSADQALTSGDVAPLTRLLVEQMRTGLMERYRRVVAARDFDTQDVDRGREYVEAYVAFIHYVEDMYEASTRSAKGHSSEGEEASHQEE